MLRYTKTLSLALLFSLPAIAMENENQLLKIDTEQNQEEVAAVSNDLASTLLVTGTYKEQQARLSELAQQREELDKKDEAVREKRNKALENLLTKKTNKEASVAGVQSALNVVQQQLAQLENQKKQKAAQIAAEIDAQAVTLKQQEATLLEDKQRQEDELAKISAIINKDSKSADASKPVETPKKGGHWYTLWFF